MNDNQKKINFNDIKLQRLRIPPGWCVVLNKFYHIDPDSSFILENHPLEFGIFEAFFESSLFSAKNKARKKFIDLSWCPMWEVNGQYVLDVYNLIEKEHKIKKRENPALLSEAFLSFSSRDREETVEMLEKILFQLSIGQPINSDYYQ